MLWSILILLVAAGGVASFFVRRLPAKTGNALCLAFVLVFIVFAVISPETRKHDLFFAVLVLSALVNRMLEQRRSLRAQSIPQ